MNKEYKRYFTADRTDLALESANSVRTDEGLPEGICVSTEKTSCFTVTDVRVCSPEAAKRIGKPVGRYITLEPNAPLDMAWENADSASKELSGYIKMLLESSDSANGDSPKSVLIAGLGNETVTPDSLGPRVCSHIFATRHIEKNAPQLGFEGMRSVSALSCGVMGQTGMEPSELIGAAVRELKPEAVIAVDALACAGVGHLGRTIQLSDAGISPGSGVQNSRQEMSKDSLGVKTIAIGIPTIADSESGMMVTPKNIDKLVSMSAAMVAMGINLCLHPSLSASELRLLTS